MFNYLRNLRHSSFVNNLPVWSSLGIIYRSFIKLIPFDFSINQYVTKSQTFKLHARFAFSNFKEWGNKHNDFFPIYLRLSKNSKCFFDVGAHIGIVSLAVSKNISSKGKIYSFEASRVNLKFIKFHIKLNKIKNITIIDKLVSSVNKKDSILFESNESSGMNSVIPIKKKKIINKSYVESVTLDKFCKIKNIIPDIIKVDIEGSEIEMLIGSRWIIKKFQPLIFLSYHPSHIKKLGYNKNFIFDIIDDLDYKVYDSKMNEPSILNNSEYLFVHKKIEV